MSLSDKVFAGARRKLVVGGGSEDESEFFPGVLRLEGNGGNILGSAVLVKPGWALAVAHCLTDSPRQLSVHHLPSQWRSAVVHVSWLSNAKQMQHPFPFPPGSAEAIRDRKGMNDCIVLLKLNQVATPALPHPGFASASTLVMGDTLAVSGYGKLEDGNYPDVYPNSAFLRFFRFNGNRGEFVEHPTHPQSGRPMGDDSGAPIYDNVESSPVVVGLHATSDHSGSNPLFRFLPITDAILRKLSALTPLMPNADGSGRDSEIGEETPIESSEPLAYAAPVPGAKRFTLRNRDCCIRMDDVAEIVGDYFLYHAKGSAGFQKCDKVSIAATQWNKAAVVYHGAGIGTHEFDAHLYRAAGQPTDRCWLVGIGNNKDKFFLMLHRPAATRARRRLIIEYFQAGSDHSEPHAGNVVAGWSCDSDPDYESCDERSRKNVWAKSPPVFGTQNQDDDGRGDE